MVNGTRQPKWFEASRAQASATEAVEIKKPEVRAPLPVYDAVQDGNVFEWILRAASSRRQAAGIIRRC